MLRGEANRRVRFAAVLILLGVGAASAALVGLGNPGNMGLCGACFLRDAAGALSLHKGPAIFRPEVAWKRRSEAVPVSPLTLCTT